MPVPLNIWSRVISSATVPPAAAAAAAPAAAAAVAVPVAVLLEEEENKLPSSWEARQGKEDTLCILYDNIYIYIYIYVITLITHPRYID